MKDITKIIGKRVKVIRGTREDRCINSNGHWIEPHENSTYSGFQQWIAGHVPIGSTGTIIPLNKHMAQIKRDRGQEPKKGYVFGLSENGLDSNAFEVITEGN